MGLGKRTGVEWGDNPVFERGAVGLPRFQFSYKTERSRVVQHVILLWVGRSCGWTWGRSRGIVCMGVRQGHESPADFVGEGSRDPLDSRAAPASQSASMEAKMADLVERLTDVLLEGDDMDAPTRAAFKQVILHCRGKVGFGGPNPCGKLEGA